MNRDGHERREAGSAGSCASAPRADRPLVQNEPVIELPAEQVCALPVDQLGLVILSDLIKSGEWNEYNYLLLARKAYSGEALDAVAEAMGWLRVGGHVIEQGCCSRN